jgi:hypothetical protein
MAQPSRTRTRSPRTRSGPQPRRKDLPAPPAADPAGSAEAAGLRFRAIPGAVSLT